MRTRSMVVPTMKCKKNPRMKTTMLQLRRPTTMDVAAVVANRLETMMIWDPRWTKTWIPISRKPVETRNQHHLKVVAKTSRMWKTKKKPRRSPRSAKRAAAARRRRRRLPIRTTTNLNRRSQRRTPMRQRDLRQLIYCGWGTIEQRSRRKIQICPLETWQESVLVCTRSLRLKKKHHTMKRPKPTRNVTNGKWQITSPRQVRKAKRVERERKLLPRKRRIQMHQRGVPQVSCTSPVKCDPRSRLKSPISRLVIWVRRLEQDSGH
mmetsp:Transcript_322/g.460  ORF Transcript_322/g.460 Transcript_322/m.460 type:complete len:264 (-) Transcript_322:240-1031(-)